MAGEGGARLGEWFVGSVALLTIAAVLTRPRGVSEGTLALAGGLLLVATGHLPLRAAGDALRGVTGVLAFLVGLFWLTLAAERAGLFARATRLTVRAARGDPRRLLAAVFVLGAMTTAVLSNDATVVLVTPVVLTACRVVQLPPLPYLFACTFVADTASSLLPISNPVNVLYAERLDIAFGRHALLLAAPTLLAVAVNAGIFHLLFRGQLPRRFDAAALLDTPPTASLAVDRVIIGGLAAVALAYVVAAFAGVEPYWVTLGGGSALALVGLVGRRVAPRDLARVQPPALYAFVAGLALVVAAVDRAGLLGALGRLVERATVVGDVPGLLALAFGSALGANAVNNWTMALAIVPTLARTGASDTLVFGSLLGVDMGPNLSVVGSLATLIWLTEVRRGGLAVSARTYVRLGLISTLPALLVATLALYGLARLL